MGGFKGSLVGESGANQRMAHKVTESVGGDSIYMIATCNRIDGLPPEVLRRFKDGIWFCDIPSEEDADDIWEYYGSKYTVDVMTDRPSSSGWTGAEIRNCCELADRFDISVKEAGKYIVPISISSRDAITKLRRDSDGKYRSANYDGLYHYENSVSGNGNLREFNND